MENALPVAGMARLFSRRAITFLVNEGIPWILTADMLRCCALYHMCWLIRDVLWLLVDSTDDTPLWLLHDLEFFDTLVDPCQQQPSETRTPMFRILSLFLASFS